MVLVKAIIATTEFYSDFKLLVLILVQYYFVLTFLKKRAMYLKRIITILKIILLEMIIVLVVLVLVILIVVLLFVSYKKTGYVILCRNDTNLTSDTRKNTNAISVNIINFLSIFLF